MLWHPIIGVSLHFLIKILILQTKNKKLFATLSTTSFGYDRDKVLYGIDLKVKFWFSIPINFKKGA